jgi:hypothetical protein
MPWIDLSFVTLDPSISAIPFRVHRRQETINDLGRSETSVQVFDAVGGVYPTGSNTLKRDPMRDFSERGITIVTRFRLQLTSIGYKPDLVEWPINSNNLWLINFVNDYSQYGRGFIEAQAVFFDPEHFDHSAA